MSNLSKVLKHIRKFNRLTQLELSSKIGVCRSYISEIESGNKTPSIEILQKYSECFDLPISVIHLFAENWEDKKDIKSRIKKILTNSTLNFLDWICKTK